MKKLFFILAVLIIVSCSSKKDIDEILSSNYTTVVIPDLLSSKADELNKNHLKEILVLMFNGIEDDEIKDHFDLNETEYKEAINRLFSQGLIKRNEEGKFIPACMIIDEAFRDQIVKDVKTLSNNFAAIVIDRSTEIKNAYSKIGSFKDIEFEKLSDFILYEVMLSRWQFKNIEEKFIKAEPPKRGNGRYYIALQEKNWLTNNSIAPQINSEDDKKLFEMTGFITDDLLNQLEYNRPLLVKSFLNSVYKDQINFREWFVWVYQFTAGEAKDILIKRGYIKR